ncbi:MAG: hypothetical protein WA125_17805 [Desulfosporosinus sp.]
MDYQNKGKINDYRVNFHNSGNIISIEVTCCGRHIGEIRFKEGENKKCSVCGTLHALKLQHNHFHIRQSRPETIETETVQTEEKAL